MDSRSVQVIWLGRAHREFRRAVSDARGTRRRARRADTFKASLQETAVPVDPTSSQQAEQLPSYNAYSVDGDVTGPLVFVNYGFPPITRSLHSAGISVKGAIVIAKYGGSWRGIKPKVAAEHGAVGCLIYSDPRRRRLRRR